MTSFYKSSTNYCRLWILDVFPLLFSFIHFYFHFFHFYFHFLSGSIVGSMTSFYKSSTNYCRLWILDVFPLLFSFIHFYFHFYFIFKLCYFRMTHTCIYKLRHEGAGV
jgi:hypothetical protein